MKKWYKPVIQEIKVQDLIKEVTVNAGSGGSGSNKCILFAGCNYGLNCENIAVF